MESTVFWVGLNHHTASPHHQKGGKDREEDTSLKPSWGKRRTIGILRVCLHPHPPEDPSEASPKELCIGDSKVRWSLAPRGFCLEHPSPLPLHLFSVWGNSYSLIKTQLNCLISQQNLPCPASERANHTLTAVPLSPPLYQFTYKTHTSTYQESSTVQKVLGTSIEQDGQGAYCQQINSIISGKIIFYFNNIFEVPWLLQLLCYLP